MYLGIIHEYRRFCEGYLFQTHWDGKWYWKKIKNSSMISADEAKIADIHRVRYEPGAQFELKKV